MEDERDEVYKGVNSNSKEHFEGNYEAGDEDRDGDGEGLVVKNVVAPPAFDDCQKYYCASDDDEGFECQKGPKGWENGIGDADDGKGFGGATDAADGGLSWPVIVKDFLGREFATEEDAYAAYKEFARFRGFGVRKGDAVRVKGVLIRRDFFCHRQGIKHPNHSEQVWEERLESRTDCKAKLKIYHDVQHNVWKVSTIIDEHNHELALTIFTHLLPSHRKMSDGDKTQVDSMK
ncbi:putative protein FAR1-RELATED SEQUENCE 10 [Arachis ipaensis]|uniref:putative protein FAR1-RELATED SEQUENCE 10 n=1 Tax=Arachis ipaensis TaxID=130454 RepID=UPI0007AF7974|nr:putative protein FAR1-RELATED SEQUENCE 10 [Arachis ipaensis]XP_025685386.1 putative protein FAR1-RELATED SEQUENCE 10 [Arachis hypogaea]